MLYARQHEGSGLMKTFTLMIQDATHAPTSSDHTLATAGHIDSGCPWRRALVFSADPPVTDLHRHP